MATEDDTRWTREEADAYEIIEGYSPRNGAQGEPTLQEALEDLWENAAPGKKRVRVVEIQMYGSNPIDMFRVIGREF